MRVVQLNHLEKSYSYYVKEKGLTGSFKNLLHREKLTKQAVRDVSLTIEEGELVGFIGPNGAGKTTVLKMLSGILYPTHGDINVLGYEPSKRKKEFLQQISIVMGQKNQLWWDLPAEDTFQFNKKIYDIKDNDFEYRYQYLVRELEVEEKLKIQVRKLSLGERMKMELIASLLHNPRLLLLDEPTIGLDIKSQKTIRSFAQNYNQQFGNSIILTSHYMKDVQELCKRLIFINEGEIIFDGEQKTLFEKYAKNKLVKLSFNDYMDINGLRGVGKVVMWDGFNADIEVPNDNISQSIHMLLEQYPICDIKIEETQLEDIVEKLM